MLKTSLAAAALVAGLNLPASAQVIFDMSVVTCKQYTDASRDQAELLGAWMSGYFSASKDINMVDFRYIERNVKKIRSYCKSHRNEALMTAVEKNAR